MKTIHLFLLVLSLLSLSILFLYTTEARQLQSSLIYFDTRAVGIEDQGMQNAYPWIMNIQHRTAEGISYTLVTYDEDNIPTVDYIKFKAQVNTLNNLYGYYSFGEFQNVAIPTVASTADGIIGTCFAQYIPQVKLYGLNCTQ